MSLRPTITAQFEQVALEQKRKLARLSDDLKLLESGLDSLSDFRSVSAISYAFTTIIRNERQPPRTLALTTDA